MVNRRYAVWTVGVPYQIKSLFLRSYLGECLLCLLQVFHVARDPFNICVIAGFFLDLFDCFVTLLLFPIDHNNPGAIQNKGPGYLIAACLSVKFQATFFGGCQAHPIPSAPPNTMATRPVRSVTSFLGPITGLTADCIMIRGNSSQFREINWWWQCCYRDWLWYLYYEHCDGVSPSCAWQGCVQIFQPSDVGTLEAWSIN